MSGQLPGPFIYLSRSNAMTLRALRPGCDLVRAVGQDSGHSATLSGLADSDAAAAGPPARSGDSVLDWFRSFSRFL